MVTNSKDSNKNNIKLFLFTDEFPWGHGEKTFVAPELDYLDKSFQVILVSLSPDEYLDHYSTISKISSKIKVIHYSRSFLVKRILLGFILMFNKFGIEEFFLIRKQGFSLGKLASAIYALGNAEDLRRFCIKKNIFSDTNNSIYYAFWFNTQCLALSIEKYFCGDLKLIARLHGYDLYKERRKYNYQPFQEFKRDMCNSVIFACKHSLRYFENEYGHELFKGQYQLNYLGVKPRYNMCNSSSDDKFRIVSCSRIDSNKRVEIIAEALSRLDRKKFFWTHFGDGSHMNQVKKIAKANDVNVSFMGNVKNFEIINYYSQNAVDVFITTTSTEGGCPVSIQEALSFGIPIIGTKIGGVPEAIDGNGILLESDPDIDSVVEAINKIASCTDEEIKGMKNRSLELFNTKFNIESNKKRLIELIKNA